MQMVTLMPTEYREVTAEEAEAHGLAALRRRVRDTTECANRWRDLSWYAWAAAVLANSVSFYLLVEAWRG